MTDESPDLDYTFLPLWTLPHWTVGRPDDPDYPLENSEVEAEANYVLRLEGAVFDEFPPGSAGDSLFGPHQDGSDPHDVFVKDQKIAGITTVEQNPLVAGTDIRRAANQTGIIGDLGRRNTNQRKRWWRYLDEMNVLLKRAKNIGHGIWAPQGTQIRPESILGSGDGPDRDRFVEGWLPASPGLPKYKYNGNETPDLFIFKDDALTGDIVFIPYIIIIRFVSLHNQLFGTGHRNWDSTIKVTTSDHQTLLVDQPYARTMLRNVHRGLNLLEEEILIQEDAAIDAELAALSEEAAMIGADQEGFTLEPLSPEELDVLTDKPEYQKYFSTTFSKEIITFVPIMQNFFLTGKYFQNINESFYASNALALEILISTIRNDDNYKNKPDLRRLPPSLAGTVDDQLDKHSASARDFILKMLIMTPINILKGLCELIDPHVGLTKIIKNVTGYAFDELAEVLNVPAEGINVAREEAALAIEQALHPGEEVDPESIQVQGINGDDLLKFILCILQVLMESLADVPRPLDDDGNPLMPTLPPNFFPDIERDGINFTGKISGLLMMPPTPLGLIYLLLGLIKFGEDEVVDALQPPDPEVCLDPEEASVTVEATEDLCEPGEVP